MQVDVHGEDIQDGDLYVFCSDGLSGMIEDAVIVRVMTSTPDLEQAVTELVDAANQAGGTDNVTVLALQCLGSN